MNANDIDFKSLKEELKDDIPPAIVCLCGSTRFWDVFQAVGWNYTLMGWIVLSIGVCKHADSEGGHGAEAISQDCADMLDELHLRKIDLAGLVVVLNVDGYIGESTAKEVAYAKSIGKKIIYLEDIEESNAKKK